MCRGTIFLTCNVSSFICPLIKNTHTNPTNYFGFSQIFPKLLPKLGRTNTCHIITKIWPIQIFLISLPKLNYKIIPSLWKPIPIYLVDKTQKAQPIYYKTCCYTTPITKPDVTRHLLQSPREIPCNICKSPSPHLAIFYKIPKYY